MVNLQLNLFQILLHLIIISFQFYILLLKDLTIPIIFLIHLGLLRIGLNILQLMPLDIVKSLGIFSINYLDYKLVSNRIIVKLKDILLYRFLILTFYLMILNRLLI